MTDEVVSFDRKKIDDMATLATGALGNPVSRMMMMIDEDTAADEVTVETYHICRAIVDD